MHIPQFNPSDTLCCNLSSSWKRSSKSSLTAPRRRTMAREAICAMQTPRRRVLPRAAVSKCNPCHPLGSSSPASSLCIRSTQDGFEYSSVRIGADGARFHPIYDEFASKGASTAPSSSNTMNTSDTARGPGYSATDNLRPHTQLEQADENSTASIKSGVTGLPQGGSYPPRSEAQSNTVLPDRTVG